MKNETTITLNQESALRFMTLVKLLKTMRNSAGIKTSTAQAIRIIFQTEQILKAFMELRVKL